MGQHECGYLWVEAKPTAKPTNGGGFKSGKANFRCQSQHAQSVTKLTRVAAAANKAAAAEATRASAVKVAAAAQDAAAAATREKVRPNSPKAIPMRPYTEPPRGHTAYSEMAAHIRHDQLKTDVQAVKGKMEKLAPVVTVQTM